MNAGDFRGELSTGRQLSVPHGEHVQATLHSGRDEDDAAWRAAGRRHF
jgi:hypothetical protein